MIYDPLAHHECLEFIRAAIASGDPQTTRDIASVIKEVCAFGQVDREQIWAELSSEEQKEFTQLVKQPADTLNIQEQSSLC